MKEIIISIKPKWIKEIVYNNKIIKLRKTYPKCELPIKAYIYCTKGNEKLIIKNNECNGYIIGEFVIDYIYNILIQDNNLLINNILYEWNWLENNSKVNKKDIINYLNKKGYGWRISKIKIYDKHIKAEDLLGINYDKKRLMSWTILK